MPPAPPVTVVIVTYLSEGVVGKSLSALRSGHDAGTLRCIVVDNASADGTADGVAREHPWATLIRSPRNLGYGCGLNLGVERVDTPHVLLMNPDVVIEPAAVSRLVRFLEENPRAGMVSPAIRRAAGNFQEAGGLPTAWTFLAKAAGRHRPGPRQGPVLPGTPAFRTDWLCGAVMGMPTPLFRELGGFDRRFFLYFEETDLCRRILRAGRELWAVGEAEAFHASNASARKVDPSLPSGGVLAEHYFRSRYYYLRKHHGPLAAASADAADLTLAALRDLGRALFGRRPKGEFRARLKSPIFSSPSIPS